VAAPAQSKPRRRTQQERRETTRTALLDATIECLIEYGYAGTTTTRVVERAGVSRGAQVHHFPTKAVLVSDALKHLAGRRASEVLRRMRKLPQGPERIDVALDMLWAAHSGPLFQAAIELWVAARTDAELRAELVTVERDVAGTVWGAADTFFGDYAKRPDFEDDVETVLSAMRGLALLGLIAPDRRGLKRRWEKTRPRLRAMLVNGPG
jgi:AcrR family transcriptional regulator